MKYAYELVASGPESHQRWSRQVPVGETCVGRAPQNGWAVTWDRYISREHFTLHVRNGMLGIRCLPKAANPIVRTTGGRIDKSFLTSGDSFRIGKTMFVVNRPGLPQPEFDKYVFSWEQLEIVRQLSLGSLAAITQAINSSCDQDAFASSVGQILVDQLDFAESIGVFRVDGCQTNNVVTPLFFQSDRDGVKHQVNHNLLDASLSEQAPVLYLENSAGERNSCGQRWMCCMPAETSETSGCRQCIYTSGRFEQPLLLRRAVDRLTQDCSLIAQLAHLESFAL